MQGLYTGYENIDSITYYTMQQCCMHALYDDFDLPNVMICAVVYSIAKE